MVSQPQSVESIAMKQAITITITSLAILVSGCISDP